MILIALHDTIHCAFLKIGARKRENRAFPHFLGLLIEESKLAASSEDSGSLVVITEENWSFSLFQWSAGYNLTLTLTINLLLITAKNFIDQLNTGAHILCVENT